MSATTVNADLFRQVMERIRAEPERWNQSTFAEPNRDHPCQTTFCVGGWAVALTRGQDWWEKWEFDVEEEAQTLLGLDDTQAAAIFYATNVSDPDVMESIITASTGVTFEPQP